jgi:hypothetical protein
MFEFPRWLTVFLEFEATVLMFLLALAIPVAIGVLLLDAWERHKRNRR